MLAAILHGKISRNVEGLEDVLTSVVFGTIERLPPELGIVPMLRRAAAPDAPAWLDDVVRVQAAYWPWLEDDEVRDGCEPDVVLTLELADESRRMIVVEAKRGAAKSGVGERDQLARQVRNAVAVGGTAVLTAVLYMTTHVARPSGEIEASKNAILSGGFDVPVWWASWRHARPLLDYAARAIREQDGDGDAIASLAADTAACLRRWRLSTFEGVRPLPAMPTYTYRRTQ